METFIIRGVSLGFSAGVLPGPFQAYIINATLMLGWRKSIVIILSPLITDIPIATLIVVILGQLPVGFIQVLRIVGGLFLLWLAYSTWKQYRVGVTLGETVDGSSTASQRALLRGVMMNFVSPGPYLFWSTVNGPLLIEALEQSVWNGIVVLIAFYGTFLLILALTVFIFDRLRRLDERVTRAILFLTIVILVWFGVTLIVQGLT
jgi:threonine/homoserine/homoserine lactone efflux protein